MPTYPQQLTHELRDVVAAALTKHVEFPDGMLVTVTRATVTGDHEQATVYLSVLPEERTAEALRVLQAQQSAVQKVVHEAWTRRRAPRLAFRIDPPAVPSAPP